MLGVGQLTEAVLTPGERNDVLGSDDLEQLLARLTLGDGVDRGMVRHQERQREQVQLRHLGRPVDGGADRHVDNALTHGGELFRLVTSHELRAGIDLHIDAAVRALFHKISPALCRKTPGERHADHGRNFVLALIILRFHRCGCERPHQQRGQSDPGSDFSE